MSDARELQRNGVALLATRLSVLGEDPCGGSEVVLWEDADILRKAGIPARVYGCAARKGAPVNVIPLRGKIAQLNSLRYGSALLRREPHATIIAYNEPALAGWAPDRTIVRFDWNTPLPRYWKWPLWRARFRRARYLFPSGSERQLFLEQNPGIPTSSTVSIPNAVDLQVFRPLEHRANMGTGHAPPLRVGFAGQWVARKGVLELMDSWRLVKSVLPSAEMVLAGNTCLWKAVTKPMCSTHSVSLVREMESQGLIRTVGAIPRSLMPKFWNSVHVAVVPSLYEPFGLVALEALACGVPVVASTAGGLKEIVQHGESGLLDPPGDVSRWPRPSWRC